VLDGQLIGHVGELHPKWRLAHELPIAPVLFELDADALLRRAMPRFVPIQRQQSIWRDLSVVVGAQVTHATLMGAIDAAGAEPFVRSARLFDVYQPRQPVGDIQPGERSLSVRLELLDDETPLTEGRIDALVAGILTRLSERLGARLRG
jgi:phenylalanyl-tRNA synthetase beta chain